MRVKGQYTGELKTKQNTTKTCLEEISEQKMAGSRPTEAAIS